MGWLQDTWDSAGDALRGDDGEWGWEDLGAGLLAPVTGGASIWANNQPGGFGGVWDSFTGEGAAQDRADAIAQAAAQDQAYEFPNVNTPMGSQTVTQNADGTVTLNQALSPQQQALVDSLYGDLGNSRQRVEDALYSRATSRLDPMWNDRTEQSRTRLYNMGLTEGDAAYDRASRNLEQARTDAYGQAQAQATAAGGAEQQRIINAILAASNPQLGNYWGQGNNAQSAIAQGNIMSQVPTGLDAFLGILGALG